MRFGRLLTVAVWLLPASSAWAVGADITSDIESLLEQSVVSTASLSAEAAAAAPATVWTVTAEEIRRYGIRSLDQAINFLTMGMLTESFPMADEVNTRGVLLTGDFGSHLLLLVDGHVVNEPWNGTAYYDRNASLPMEIVDHIEIALGPGSVLYGSNAMLGVIHVLTRRGRDLAGVHLVAESELPTSARVGAAFGQELELAGKRFELMAAAEYTRVWGPVFSVGPQDYGADAVSGEPRRFSATGPGTGIWGGNTDDGVRAQLPTGMLRLRWGDLELSTRVAMARRGTPYNNYANFDDPKAFERDRWLSADARYTTSVGAVGSLFARLYGDLYDYRQNLPSAAPENCLEGQDSGCVYRADGRSRWAGAELRGTVDWLLDGRLVTMVGCDSRVRDTGQRDHYFRLPDREAVETIDYANVERAAAVYAQQTFNPSPWLALNAGVRVDYDEGYPRHLAPRAAVSLAPWSGGTVLKVVYSDAFRAPSPLERYYEDPAWHLASPDLRPEVVRSVETSVEQQIGSQRVLVAVFRTWWEDLIVDTDLSEEEISEAQAAGILLPSVDWAARYRNVTSLENYGINLAWTGVALARRLRYGATLSIANTGLSAEDGSDPRTPRAAGQLFGNARIAYSFAESSGPPTIGLAARFVHAREIDQSDFEPTPKAPTQVELRLSVTGPVPSVAGLSYRVTGHYALSDAAPYKIGPLAGPTDTYTEQEFTPVDTLRMMVGLTYDLSGGSGSDEASAAE